ncbi:MAG: hypothetical protein RIB84_26505 [Sneathiellaceae bacterium]
MTAPAEPAEARRPGAGVAARPVLWAGLGVLLLLAGGLAVTAAIFALSDTPPGPVDPVRMPAMPLRGLATGLPAAQEAARDAGPGAPRLPAAMAAVAARPDPLAPLAPAEIARFRTGQAGGSR